MFPVDGLSGCVSSMFMWSHACLASVVTCVGGAYVAVYTIGGGTIENSFCASFVGSGVEADSDVRILFVAPGRTLVAVGTL